MNTKRTYFLQKLNAVVSLDNKRKHIKPKDQKIIILGQWIYFSIILFSIFFSFVALAIPVRYSKDHTKEISIVQFTTFLILIVDYVFLAMTSIVRLKKHKRPLLKFFFSFTSILLLISISSSLYTINLITETDYKFLKHLRSFSIIKMARLLMLLTFFSSFKVLINVFKEQKVILNNVFIFIIVLIAVLALIIWNAEASYADDKILIGEWLRDQDHLEEVINQPGLSSDDIAKLRALPVYADINNIVNDYWDALYFTTISLTTIGYGDIIAFSTQTKTILVFTSLVGIAIFAIPSGVIAGSFLTQVQANIQHKEKMKQERLAQKAEKEQQKLAEKTEKKNN